MQRDHFIAAFLLGALVACNAERKDECDKFTSAMSPMQQGDTPSGDAVDRVRQSVEAIQFQDEPLREYAKNYRATLAVLSNTLNLKATADADGPPAGTDDVIKSNLKEARTDFDDISRYCSP
jgi:hypothetical protein